MKIDFQQPPPHMRTLEEAQVLINALWPLLRALTARIEEQAQLLGKQAQTIEEQGQCIQKQAQLIEAQAQRIDLLEEQLRTNSRNSSQPPSTDPHRPPAPKAPTGRKRGAQPGHPGKARTLLPPEQSRVTGPRLLAAIGAFAAGYHLSKRQVQGVLADLFGIELSVGAISEGEAEIGDALCGIVAEAHAHVRQAPVVHADETGHKQSGCRHWLWLVMAGTVAVFLTAATRSAQAARAALGEGFGGILISDRYGAYAWVDTQRRQLCWAHLLRDFAKMAERSGPPGRIGDELIACAERMFRFWRRVRDGTLRRDMFACHMLFLRYRIETLLRQGADGPHAGTARTCRNLLRLRCALWTFIDTPGVEPTNNLAERSLRGFVTWRKISFGTQSDRGSRYVGRIMTVAGSCKL